MIRRTLNPPTPARPLTERQVEVLTLITDGYTNEEVAQIMKLAQRTVEAHRVRIMVKLNICELAGLVKYALRFGMTTIDTHRTAKLPRR